MNPGIYPMERSSFWLNHSGLSSIAFHNSERCALVDGDCLQAMDCIPNGSIQLILTDPPYHTTKKANIAGDTSFSSDEEYLEWMQLVALKWKKILAPNGTIYCFCASKIAARLEVMFAQYFNIIGTVTWTKPNAPGYDGWKQKMKKEALRGWYLHSEKIICMETKLEGNLKDSFFGQYLKGLRLRSGLSSKELTEKVGAYKSVNNGGAVSNWETGRNIPSETQYKKMCNAFLATGRVSSQDILSYRDAVRPFSVSSDVEFTDVWTFENVRQSKGKHPAEKPTSLLAHVISSSSLPGDIVLDCFSGSGSTIYTALQMNRKAIGIEIDPRWIHYQLKRIESAEKSKNSFLGLGSLSNAQVAHSDSLQQLSLVAS